MNQDNKIDVFDRENIERVIHIVNNIVYKGKGETQPEIDERLKEKLKPAFVDFFGNQHKDKVTQRIEDMTIYRVFHIIGNRNSISELLLDEKAKNYPIDPAILPHYITTPPEQLLEEAKNNSLSAERLEKVCKLVGFTIEQLKDASTHRRFIGALREYYNSYQNAPYSEDPLKNEQLQFLEQYVESYKEYLIQNDVYDYIDNTELICSHDPLFSTLMECFSPDERKAVKENLSKAFFSKSSNISALSEEGTIALGLNPNGSTIIHEVFHVVVTNKTNRPYSSGSGIDSLESRWFGETVVDYFSRIIFEKFFSSEKDSLTSNNNENTGYNELTEKISTFLRTFTPEFKEALMNSDPITATQTLIGSDTFYTISDCLDILFTQAVGPNSNLLIKEYKEYTKEDIEQAETMLKQAQNVSTYRNKSALENLFNIISIDSEGVANTIKKSNNPVFQKIAQAIYYITTKINTHTQKKVAKILNSPPDERQKQICKIKESIQALESSIHEWIKITQEKIEHFQTKGIEFPKLSIEISLKELLQKIQGKIELLKHQTNNIKDSISSINESIIEWFKKTQEKISQSITNQNASPSSKDTGETDKKMSEGVELSTTNPDLSPLRKTAKHLNKELLQALIPTEKTKSELSNNQQPYSSEFEL